MIQWGLNSGKCEQTTMENHNFTGKNTMSMVIFHSYVSHCQRVDVISMVIHGDQSGSIMANSSKTPGISWKY